MRMRPSLKRRRAAPSSRVHGVSSYMSQTKKVKFADSARLHEQSRRRDASSPQPERKSAPNWNSNDSKTNEYKAFKKLCEEAGRKTSTRQHHQQGNNLDALEEGDYVEAFKYRVTNDPDESNLLFPLQKVTPNIRRSHLSPDKAPQHPGPSDKHGGIFLKKRENLLQMAAKTLSLGMDELKFKRSKLISDLLLRVGFGRKSKLLQWQNDELPKSLKKKSDGRYQLLASSESDGYFEDSCEDAERDQLTIGAKNWANDSLSISHHEIDVFSVSPLDYVETKAFRSSYAPTPEPSCLRDASVFDAHLENFHVNTRKDLIAIAATELIANQSPFSRYSEAPKSILRQLGNFVHAQAFPHLTASAPSLQHCGRRSRWVSDSRRLSNTSDHLLSEYGHSIPNSCSSLFQFTEQEQELAPHYDSPSMTLCNIHSFDSHLQAARQQQSTLPLLGWDDGGQEEREFSAPPLPLVSYIESNIFDQMRGSHFGEGYEATNLLETSPDKRPRLTIQDGSDLLLDVLLQSSRFESKPQWNGILASSPMKVYSPICTDLGLLVPTEGTLASMSPRNIYQFSIDAPRCLELESQFPSSLLTDRIYWHEDEDTV